MELLIAQCDGVPMTREVAYRKATDRGLRGACSV